MRFSGDGLPTVLSYVFAFALGLYITLSVFPVDFIWPPVIAAHAISQDFAQHIIGQRYFIADAWRWPLLDVPRLNFPDGVHVAFTDSIPVLAMLLKAFSFLLPDGFHGFGLWYALTWTMQPVTAVWCLRAAGERRLLPAVCIAVVAIAMPSWWNRFPHASLTAHFLIWIVFGLYFYIVRYNTWRYWVAAFLFIVVALFTHPYLWAMTAALLAAVPLTHVFNGDARWRSSLLASLVAIGASIGVAWQTHYLGAHGGGGFGIFGMNLLSPFWPAGSTLLPFDLPLLYTQEYGAWEGYQYLGLGMLIGLVFLLLVRRGALLGDLRRHAGLVLASVFMVVFSLSSTIGIGGYILEDFYATNRFPEGIKSLFDHFRSSGRMFWPVAYMLVLAVVLGLSRVRNAWLRTGLLVIVAVIQFADNRNARVALARELYTSANNTSTNAWPFDVVPIREAISRASVLRIYPRWECVPQGDTETELGYIIQLLVIASETAVPVNTMYLARWHDKRDCADHLEIAAPLEPGETRIIGPTARQAYAPRIPDAERYCRDIGQLTVCSRPAEDEWSSRVDQPAKG
ncbi:DUF6311 domain-containing protein [Pseudochelatococcus sp. B33]